MIFDLEGARKAGYSDAEIASGLASNLGFDYAGAKNAGYDDTEILDNLYERVRPATLSDYPKSFASGVLSGTGMIFQGGGELLARGINAVAGTELKSVNPLQGAIDWLEQSKTQGRSEE